jgi:hypothetical protein
MLTSAALIDMVLRSVPPRPNTEYWLPQEVRSGVREMVAAPCRESPVPGHPIARQPTVGRLA